jgi:phosphoribosylformylglycinamidine synthase PurS subunit
VPKVVVDVMPKPRLGFDGVVDVRQGKRFELEVAGEVTEAVLARVHEMAETLLSNPVIENFTVRVDEAVAESA